MSLRPKDVSDLLGISPATLRLWSTKFESYLSPGAQRSTTENGGSSQRRYDEADLQYFNRAKQLLAEGLTYGEVFSKLDEGVRVVALDNVPMPQAPTTSPISDVVIVSEVAEQYQKTIAALEQTVRSQQETIYYQGQVIEGLRDDRRALHTPLMSFPPMNLRQRLDWLLRGRMISDQREERRIEPEGSTQRPIPMQEGA